VDRRHEAVLLTLALAPGAAAALLPAGEEADRLVLLLAAGAGALVLALLAAAASGLSREPRWRAVLVAAAVARLLAALGPARFDDDLWRYLWDGAATNAGVSPYRFAPEQVLRFDPEFDPILLGADQTRSLGPLLERAADPRLRPVLERINFSQYPTLYPPASQMAFALAAAVAPGSDRLWRLLAAAADLGAAALLAALLGRLGRPIWWSAAYALHPLPALESAAAGHQDALGVALLLAAALALAQKRHGRAGAALAAAAGVKLFPGALALPWARALGSRGLLAALAAAALLAGPFLLLGPPKLDGLAVYLRRWEFFSGPYALLAWLGGRAGLAAVLLALALASRPLRPRPAKEQLGLGLLWVEALVLLSPVVNPWYVPWAIAAGAVRGSAAWPVFGLLVPLAYVPHAPEGHPWPLRVAAWAPLLGLLAWEALRRARSEPQAAPQAAS
jgi:hypothetical protein